MYDLLYRKGIDVPFKACWYVNELFRDSVAKLSFAVYTPTTMGAGSWGIKSSQSVARDGGNNDDDVQLPSSSGRDEWLQEKNLVDELTAPGGIRAAPPKDKLAHFLDR